MFLFERAREGIYNNTEPVLLVFDFDSSHYIPQFGVAAASVTLTQSNCDKASPTCEPNDRNLPASIPC
jgi:hypothetical protein